MLESIIRDGRLQLAIVVAVVAIVLVAFASARRRHRRNSEIVRREPVMHGRRRGHPEMEPGYRPSPDRLLAESPGRRFGFVTLLLSFVIGAIVGAAGLAASSSGRLADGVNAVVAWLDAASGETRETPGLQDLVTAGAKADAPLSASTNGDPRPGDGAAGDPSGDVKLRLAAFAGNLQKELPKDAGPEIALSSVAVAGNTLSLGYSVGRSMSEDEIAAFDAYVMRTIKSLFCGKEAREIRFLNENGVAFHMVYADPKGQTVAKLTVPPHYCA